MIFKFAIDELKVCYQTAEKIVVSHFHDPIPLCVIPSCHSLSTEYKWLLLGYPESLLGFPSSPVVFVHQEGVYQCTITCGERSVTPHLMTVKLQAEPPIGNSHVCIPMCLWYLMYELYV